LQKAQLLEAYQQMSILLLMSELETLPMAIEQEMAAGKAVVARK
jgi:glycosyltransferase involved in cell wall biosynthesis